MKLSQLMHALNEVFVSEGDLPVFLTDISGSTIIYGLDSIESSFRIDGQSDGSFTKGPRIVVLKSESKGFK